MRLGLFGRDGGSCARIRFRYGYRALDGEWRRAVVVLDPPPGYRFLRPGKFRRELVPRLYRGRYFVPGPLGVVALNGSDPEMDHPWHVFLGVEKYSGLVSGGAVLDCSRFLAAVSEQSRDGWIEAARLAWADLGRDAYRSPGAVFEGVSGVTGPV